MKNYERCYFVWILTLFDLRPRNILVILAEKGTLDAPMSERVEPHHFGCSRGPMERK